MLKKGIKRKRRTHIRWSIETIRNLGAARQPHGPEFSRTALAVVAAAMANIVAPTAAAGTAPTTWRQQARARRAQSVAATAMAKTTTRASNCRRCLLACASNLAQRIRCSAPLTSGSSLREPLGPTSAASPALTRWHSLSSAAASCDSAPTSMPVQSTSVHLPSQAGATSQASPAAHAASHTNQNPSQEQAPLERAGLAQQESTSWCCPRLPALALASSSSPSASPWTDASSRRGASSPRAASSRRTRAWSSAGASAGALPPPRASTCAGSFAPTSPRVSASHGGSLATGLLHLPASLSRSAAAPPGPSLHALSSAAPPCGVATSTWPLLPPPSSRCSRFASFSCSSGVALSQPPPWTRPRGTAGAIAWEVPGMGVPS